MATHDRVRSYKELAETREELDEVMDTICVSPTEVALLIDFVDTVRRLDARLSSGFKRPVGHIVPETPSTDD